MRLRVISLSCLLATGMWAAAPAISGISPDPIDAGGPYFLLTIRGIGFVPSSIAKLGATGRTDAVAKAMRLGLVMI